VRAVIRKHHAIVYPLGVYVATRLLFLAATATGPQLQTPKPSVREFVTRWDAVYYLTLVQHGYPRGSTLQSEHAFFPLYPLLVRVADLFLPQSEFVAAVSVSLAAGAVAAVLFWRLAARLADRDAADRAVLVFCLFPGTIVFGWPYADALLVALMCASICLLLDGRWLAAAVVAALASATRPSGLTLVVACAVVAYTHVAGDQPRRVLAGVGAALLAMSGFVAFVVWLGNHTGNAMQWFDVERDLFDEGTPWRRLPTTIADVFRDGPAFPRMMVIAFAAIAVVLLLVGCTAGQPLWAVSITVLALYLALTANIANSSPRLQLAAIPAFVALGSRLRDRVLLWWCVASAALAVMLVFVYGTTTLLAP
jgi:hypothetical protein